jgi:hypothetical protein
MLNDALKKVQNWTPNTPASTYWTPYSSAAVGTFQAKEVEVTKAPVNYPMTQPVSNVNPYL